MADLQDNYYYDISYEDAEMLLQQQSQDGTFLIRPSKSKPGTFAISLRYRIQIFH